jgi:outer membrane receptor protein involved in Fe transport
LWNAAISLANIPAFHNDNVGVSLWMNNITNKKYMLDGVSGFPWIQPGAQDVSVLFGDPRTFGINITYRH